MHTVVFGISQMLINLCTGLFIITLTFKILIANRIMSNFQCKDQDCSILHRTSHGLLVQWQKTPLHCLCKWSFMLSSFFLVHFDWLYVTDQNYSNLVDLQGQSNTQGLKHEWPSPIGDIRIVSSFSTFVLNTWGLSNALYRSYKP